MIRGVLVLALIACAFAPATTRAQSKDPISSGIVAIQELRIEDAARELASVGRAANAVPEARFLSALVDFYQGRYQEAASTLDETIPRLSGGLRSAAESQRAAIDGAARRTRGFATMASANGRYVVRFEEGLDRTLAPYALAQLAAADRTLEALLGYHHPGPIRLEFYGDPEALADVSTLSVQAIETTGTIAICKFDRLMVTSPRVLSQGYPWADTISHELVHLLLARATRDHAPTWFHEGIAKFLETSPYYGVPVLSLDPSERKILHDRLVANDLLPFERFYPSVAMLPTPEDAALAYAEASTAVATFHREKGTDGLHALIRRIAEDVEPRAAMTEMLGVPFDRWIEGVWAEVRRQPAPTAAEDPRVPRFTHGEERADDDASEVRSPEATKHVRLGDMLWARQHALGASREYARALSFAPTDPVVLSRLGRSALEGGDARAAVDAARTALVARPDHAPARALLAAALARAGDRHEAMLAAYDALRYNPFDPSPHCVLADVAEDEPTRARERGICQSLAPGAPSPP